MGRGAGFGKFRYKVEDSRHPSFSMYKGVGSEKTPNPFFFMYKVDGPLLILEMSIFDIRRFGRFESRSFEASAIKGAGNNVKLH